MAILNQRLFPIIEMLVELGMDWLAFELIEGIRRGQEPQETEDAPKHARQETHTPGAEKFARSSGDSVDSEPLVGYAQLEWSVHYINERIEATLNEMSASLCALDKIASSAPEAQTETAESSAVLVLVNGEEEREVSQTQVIEAQAHLPKLRQSLENWLESTQSGLDR